MSSTGAHDSAAAGATLTRVQVGLKKISSTLVALKQRPGPARDSYDRLVDRLIEQPLRRRMLFVTSAVDGEGTTTTAANLAGCLSRRSSSVLLAEMRLTQPGLLRILGDPADVPGFEEGLRGERHLPDCAFQVTDSPLHIMAIKSAVSEVQAATQSGALNEFVVWAEQAFEWVVLDCPPVTSAAWTRWFDLNADPALLVARSKVSQAKELKRAARMLKDHLAGAILNDRQVA